MTSLASTRHEERLSLLESKVEEVHRSHQEKIDNLEHSNREKGSLIEAYEKKLKELEQRISDEEAPKADRCSLYSNELADELANLNESDWEPGEHNFLPPDVYSYLACTKYFTKRKIRCGEIPLPTATFCVAMMVCTVQVLTLSIFLSDIIDLNNKGNPIRVPADVSTGVSFSQLIALLISCFCQDEVRASFNVMRSGFNPQLVRQISHNTSVLKWYFSAYVRIALGVLNLIVTFILIVNSKTVRDVMLDFAAATFVSELDNGAFTVAQWGYFGHNLKTFTVKIQETPVYDKNLLRKTLARGTCCRVPRLVSMGSIVSIMFISWSIIKFKQMHGAYVDDTIFVQFGDGFSPSLGAFSGLYELETKLGTHRSYLSKEIGPHPSGISKFIYCELDKSWVFQYGEEQSLVYNKGCWSRARSSKTLSYDIVDSSSGLWFVHDTESSLDMPLHPFYISGLQNYYGQVCDDNTNACGDRMSCVDGKCACKDDKFGLLCQFPKPCEKVELDERNFNGFTGTRTWSRSYRIMKRQGETDSAILTYGKPIYIGDDEQVEGVYDVMMFTGRRWVLTDSNWIQIYDREGTRISATNKTQYAELLSENFHAYWSNYTFFFTTEPVDVGEPTDSATPQGLQWYRLDTASDDSILGFDFHSKDAKKIWKSKTLIQATLFCTVCNSETNPCYYGGVCSNDGTCECSTGSKGKLCQIPPDGNGFCDLYFNTPEFNYDGGDCCIETCKSTEENICGDGIIENDAGLEARGHIAFPNCNNPRFKSKISGSVTLHDIVERGTVRCGFILAAGYFELNDGVYSGFESEFCNAIAAAALGDPNAVEYIVYEPKDRFLALENGEIDVLFWTTYTAERDVHESTAKVGFTFTSSPHFYDGMKFGGLPPFVNCADNTDFESAECVDIKICALSGSSWLQRTKELFPDRFIAIVDSIEDQYEALDKGLCNVHVGESNVIAEVVVRNAGFSGSGYEVGEKAFSKEPLAPVTRKDDRVWSKFVSWVVQALVQAEAAGITQASAERLAPADVFGEQFRYMFKNAVAANGNYGEIYEKTLEKIVPRSGLSVLNTGGSGMVYSFPFGNYESHGPSPITGGTIESIRKRGVLNCGVVRKFGFAKLDAATTTWRGLDVDICRGIAAALFNGSPNVNFIPLISSQRFTQLARGSVDILSASTTHTLTREVKEALTGESFDFSPPYFYDGLTFAGIPTYVLCADDFAFRRTDCTATLICVPSGTTWLDSLRGPLNVPDANVLVTSSHVESKERFILGDCNVFAGEMGDVIEDGIREIGYTGEYYVGTGKHTREPLAVVSRSDDIQFSDFVRWIIFGFFFAAEQRITKETYYDLPATNFLFGDYLSAMWQHAVEASGNYEEILKRNFGEESGATKGLNSLNDGTDPIFYPIPGIVFD